MAGNTMASGALGELQYSAPPDTLPAMVRVTHPTPGLTTFLLLPMLVY